MASASVMISAPILLDDIEADIAAVHFANQRELLSGTVYLGNTAKCNEAVDRWIEINEKYPVKLPNGRDAWDQRTLEISIKETPGFNFVELPQSYTWIIGLTQKKCPNETHPVIMHTRGAKRFKRRIDGQKGYAK